MTVYAVHAADDEHYEATGDERPLCRFLRHAIVTGDPAEVSCRACRRKLGQRAGAGPARRRTGDDGEGRLRRAVYLPAECWEWLEATAAHDRSSRSDLLEGLVLAAMDPPPDPSDERRARILGAARAMAATERTKLAARQAHGLP